jgi:hypothetical protein
MTHPYRNLGDHQFWRRAISATEPHAVDPVVNTKFRINQSERVATAGSCFSQHISRRLSSIGFNYYVPESGLELTPEERSHRGYGVFSARYGNIYTVGQLLQLFEEAIGIRSKNESAWLREDGRYVDPFRPNIESTGFDSPPAVLSARRQHMAYVSQVFLNADIFVFTLGLTESWVSKSSGDIFPFAPGVAGGCYDPELYSFVNNSINDVVADLKSFLSQLKGVNPKVRVLLTVSPVPLIATFENRHVLVSTTYSKSVLRVAAEMAMSEFEWVDYFPSYEIITGNFNMGRYFEDDMREINGTGVGHAMRCFFRNYVSDLGYGVDTPEGKHKYHPDASSQGQFSQMENVICDEELIEKVSF